MRLIDFTGYATPLMVLLMTREMIFRVSDMFSHVAGVILGIAMCFLPGLSPHLMLLPMSALRLWDTMTGALGAAASRNIDRSSDAGG